MFIEPSSKKDIWNPHFYNHFEGFASILPFWKTCFGQCHHDWPSVDDYNDFAKINALSNSLCFIEQFPEMRYLWEIYHHRKIPTRIGSWHDFFNNLTWIVFPKLKRAIVSKMCQGSVPDKTRTPLQNTLAHFDECGIVLCSDNATLFTLIENFQWKTFFCQTDNLLQHCLPVLIGHGLMEKALNPYIGMTAKAVFLQVDSAFFSLTTTAQNQHVDEAIADYITSSDFPTQPKSLHPFPLLGWPQWHGTQDEAFYNNRAYFREGRASRGK